MTNYPLIRRLAWIQITTLFAGLLLFLILNAVLYNAESKISTEKALGTAKGALNSEYERLLSWKALGMPDAVSEDIAKLRKNIALDRLEVVSDPVTISDYSRIVILPDLANPSILGYRLLAEVPRPKSFFSTIPPVTLFSCGLLSALFLALVIYSSLLLRTYFKTLVVLLEQSLSQLGRGNAPDFHLPKAEGEVKRILEIIRNLYLKTKETERIIVIGNLAAQVAHDIRSPLAALEIAAGDVSQLPEDKRILIRSAVSRVRDIANSLLDRQHALAAETARAAGVIITPNEIDSPQLLSSLIESLVTEKRQQFKSRSQVEIEVWLDPSSYGIFAKVQSIEFKRLLSNIINNAVESFGNSPGSALVSLTSQNDWALVSVKDNGKGISPEVLSKLGQRGETHGKTGGSGLGLYHAVAAAESWGGLLKIDSDAGKGTKVTIELPLSPVPDWFVAELALIPGRTVLVLDDDVSIHQVWQGRLDMLQRNQNNIEIVHVSNPEELKKWVTKNEVKAREALYLLDYELVGYPETGLSLAKELRIGNQSILVTSHFEETAILEGCRKLKTRMIPKGLAGLVPLRVTNSISPTDPEREHWDAVLIDDDPLVRMTWRMAANRAGKKLREFSTASEFFKGSRTIDRKTSVYVDAELGDEVKGDAVSLQIHELGFDEIYLATGHEPGKFSRLTHLRGVIGKEPPWKT